MFGHRAGDRGIEAAIQDVEFFGGHRNALLNRDLGNGLADVAVVVHDLGNVESQRAQLAPMLERRRADRVRRKRRRRGLQPKRLGELGQEERHAVFELAGRHQRPRPIRELGPRPRDDGVAIRRDEFVKH